MKHLSQITREFIVTAGADDSIDSWWKNLSNEQQREYIAKHPKTHFRVTAPKESPAGKIEHEISKKHEELEQEPEISIDDLTGEARELVDDLMSTIDEDFVMESQNYIEDMIQQKVIDGSVTMQHNDPKNVKAVSDYFSQLNDSIKNSKPAPNAPDNEVQKDMIKNSLMYAHVLAGEMMKERDKSFTPEWGGDEPTFEQKQKKVSDDAVKSYIKELIFNVLK